MTSAIDCEALDRLARLRDSLSRRRELSDDIRMWLLDGLDRFELNGDLTVALGLKLSHGSGFNAATLIRRAAMESALIQAADCIGPRNTATASRMARALAGDVGAVPGMGLDFLLNARRRFGDDVPVSRSAIARILTGETRAARWHLIK